MVATAQPIGHGRHDDLPRQDGQRQRIGATWNASSAMSCSGASCHTGLTAGHFFAGDYTAVWIDNTSAGPRYRHFSPLVLFKGQHPILSTHNLNLHQEQFVLDTEHGNMPYPPIETLHATEGSNIELTTQTEPGHIVAWEYVTEIPGTDVSPENPVGYHRQYGPINVQIRRWDQLESSEAWYCGSSTGCTSGSLSPGSSRHDGGAMQEDEAGGLLPTES